MKKDWTETMRDKLSESTATPPDNLWASISSDLDAAMKVQPPRRKHRILWWGAAACLGVLILTASYFMVFNERPSMPNVGMAINDIPGKHYEHNNKKESEPEMVVQQITSVKTSIFTDTDALAQAKEIKYKDNKSENTYINTNYSERQEGTDDLENQTSIAESNKTQDSSEPDYESLLIAQAQEQNAMEMPIENHRGISISLFAANPQITGITNSDGDSHKDIMSSPNQGFNTDDVSSAEKSKPKSRAADTKTLKESQHKQPLRVGLSARIPLTDDLSVSTGVTYSRLSSTLTWTSDMQGTFDREQTLHYIGIPVSIDYNLPSSRAFGFYLTSGAMVEKCIYGESYAQNHLSERVSEKRLQMSLFAGAGVQFNITDHIGIYAEPLTTYYFDNHSDVINIYKDRTFNIDLRVGLRYTLK